MDPVSLALGVAPLCLSALKATKCARRKIGQLRHHDHEISRLRKKFKTQISIFRDESQILLLDSGIDNLLASEMMSNYGHVEWMLTDLDELFEAHLGSRYEEVRGTSEDIKNQVEILDEILGELEDDHSNSGKLSVATQRARNAVGLAASKTKLDKCIESLVESIADFRRLRKAAKAIQKPRVPRNTRHKKIPREYNLVARHSSAFYDSFVTTWSCLKSSGMHSRHTAKLFLDTNTTEEGVDFKMILEYELIAGTLRQQSLLFLRVQSSEISLTGVLMSGPSSCSPQEENEPPRKARRVRFADTSARQSTVETCRNAVSNQSQDMAQASNLCNAKDVCHHVFEHGKALCQSHQEACVGYLDSRDNLRHRLMTASDKQSTALQANSCATRNLATIVEPSKETEVLVTDQLRLALQIARSVLQFHSTPWWRCGWSLSDLSYFDIDSELSTSLSTLHIDMKLVPKGDGMAMQGVLTEVPHAPHDSDSQLLCGLRNVTLHSLGAALLQIGRWEPLDPEDVLKVRKTAEKKSLLGPRYDALVEKCLYCDFGFGKDLCKPQLQAAVYENVVCELEEMVRYLEARQDTDGVS